MSTITITSTAFGTIGAITQADAPATLTIDLVTPGPVGPAGPTGPIGPQGPQGDPGVGVPAGGSEGQILSKVDATDFNTTWIDNYATELRIVARNETGATLSKGTVVYINGASGNKPTLAKALATGDATSAQTLGLVAADILNNQNGEVTVRGLLIGVDTSAYAAGTQLYLSGTTAGAFTSTKPVAPIHIVYVGIVSRSHANQGQIEVAVQNGWELGEIHDVLITSPTNGQVLKYDAATDLWKNQTDLNSGVWGQITGTLSSQTDLQNALDGKYSTSNPAGYITSSALSGYLLSTTAALTYYPLTNPSGYITSSALSPYLLSSTAASTYLPFSGGTVTGDLNLQGGGVDLFVRASAGSNFQRAKLTSSFLQFASDDSSSPYHLTAGASSSDSTLNLFRTADGKSITSSVSALNTNGAPVIKIDGLAGDLSDYIEIREGKFLLPNATITEPYLRADGNLANLADASVARTNLGLGTMATQSAGSYALLSGAAFTGNVTASANSISARRLIGQPNSGVAGVNIGIGGTDTSSTTAGDLWITTGGTVLNYRDATGAWRQILTNNQIASIDTSSVAPALRVTQRGIGEAFRVEDSTTPDATAFVIDQFGKVGVGVSPDASAAINVDANGIRWNTGGGVVQQLAAPVTASGTYDKEIAVTINGTNYRIPCRQV